MVTAEALKIGSHHVAFEEEPAWAENLPGAVTGIRRKVIQIKYAGGDYSPKPK
jgi:hypothetical protein